MNVAVKRGMLLRHHNRLYFVDGVSEHHSGQQRPAIHIALRDALDGRHVERTLDELLPLDEVSGGYRALQYLYAKGESRVFMDSQTFEEVELSGPALGGFEPFLTEGEEFRVYYADDRPLHLEMPDTVPLTVADTAAPSHAVGAAGSVLKEAVLANGLTVRVPLFIKNGDTIRVNTRSREYVSKA